MPRELEIIEKAVAAHAETQARLVSVLTKRQRAQLDKLPREFLAGLESRKPG